jgi:hypothetical protein
VVYGLAVEMCRLKILVGCCCYTLVSTTRLLGRSWDGCCGACGLALRYTYSKFTTFAAEWRSDDFQRKAHDEFNVYVFDF